MKLRRLGSGAAEYGIMFPSRTLNGGLVRRGADIGHGRFESLSRQPRGALVDCGAIADTGRHSHG
ncbi:hypothetical protein ASE16_15485 [Leifsonia sp. Root227]|nr:hypothetical protein ASE16_15485 [Leifsonia sp. Root227]